MPNARIVVIEDHVMMQQFFAALLRDQLQLTVVAECTTVAEGIAACLRNKPDLAVAVISSASAAASMLTVMSPSDGGQSMRM